MKPVAITCGEPAGIGVDLLIEIAQEALSSPVVVIADPEVILQRADKLSLPIKLAEYTDASSVSSAGELCVLPVNCRAPVIAGQLDRRNAEYILETLRLATAGCQSGQFSAMVTAPLHKGIINDAGVSFSGHTEYLAALTNTPLPVMMLASDAMRVALVTTHLPLNAVSQAITAERLRQTLYILHQDLRHTFNIADPRIHVCGLNPHAGESGHLGREEIDVIEPVLEQLRSEGMKLYGPLPADTLFTPKYLDNSDAVLAMYHDQGLPVLKYSGFGNAINITLGLPIIRTSVDHGTALDLAGTGLADSGSLRKALAIAIELASHRVP